MMQSPARKNMKDIRATIRYGVRSSISRPKKYKIKKVRLIRFDELLRNQVHYRLKKTDKSRLWLNNEHLYSMLLLSFFWLTVLALISTEWTRAVANLLRANAIVLASLSACSIILAHTSGVADGWRCFCCFCCPCSSSSSCSSSCRVRCSRSRCICCCRRSSGRGCCRISLSSVGRRLRYCGCHWGGCGGDGGGLCHDLPSLGEVDRLSVVETGLDLGQGLQVHGCGGLVVLGVRKRSENPTILLSRQKYKS